MLKLLILAALAATASAHESCCAKKARLAKLRTIPDPNAEPPAVDAAGEPRLVANTSVAKPAGWDDEDDGPWAPPLIDNPRFRWTAPMVDNPDYDPPTFLAELQSEVEKAAPWVVLGSAITASLELAQLPLHSLGALLGGAGPVGAALVGLATPLCSCGALPVAAGFIRGGVPLRAVVAFLTASQSAGLDSAAITWGLLGPAAALCRLGGAFLLAVAAGFAVAGPAARSSKISTAAGAKAAAGAKGGLGARAVGAILQSAADTFPPVLLGLALSAAVSRFVPALPNAPHELGGADGLAARLAVLGAALPLQLCEHSTVTAAAAIQKAGGSAGVAFAFLLSAPATNLPSLLLLLSGAAAARVAAALTAAALLLSYAVDAAGVDLLVEREAEAGAGGFALPEWYVGSSPWLAALLAAAAVARAAEKRRRRAKKDECCDAKDDCCDDGPAPRRSARLKKTE